jgi:hypothetical protein
MCALTVAPPIEIAHFFRGRNSRTTSPRRGRPRKRDLRGVRFASCPLLGTVIPRERGRTSSGDSRATRSGLDGDRARPGSGVRAHRYRRRWRLGSRGADRRPRLRGPVRTLRRVGLLRSSRKPSCECTLVGSERPRPVGQHVPLVGRAKGRPDTRAHFALLRLRSDEHRAEYGDFVTGHDLIVVRPSAWTIVLCGSTEFRRDRSAYRLGVCAVCKRERGLVYMMRGVWGHVVGTRFPASDSAKTTVRVRSSTAAA